MKHFKIKYMKQLFEFYFELIENFILYETLLFMLDNTIL